MRTFLSFSVLFLLPFLPVSEPANQPATNPDSLFRKRRRGRQPQSHVKTFFFEVERERTFLGFFFFFFSRFPLFFSSSIPAAELFHQFLSFHLGPDCTLDSLDTLFFAPFPLLLLLTFASECRPTKPTAVCCTPVPSLAQAIYLSV